MTEDVIVYVVPGGELYLGWFSEHGWFEWPAVRDGWARRRAATSSAATDAVELPPDLARLALRLSGVFVGDVG